MFCPECAAQIADGSQKCTFCKYDLNQYFDKDYSPKCCALSKKLHTGWVRFCIILIVSIGLIILGLFTLLIGVGVVPIGIGIAGIIISFKQLVPCKFGKCPHCETDLKIKLTTDIITCPKCSGKSRVSEEALISIRSEKEKTERILNTIESLFQKVQWNVWDNTIHGAAGQIDRILRATSQDIQVINYSEKSGYAKIRGQNAHYYLTTQHKCSCPDFRKRLIPCKHMYHLAIALSEKESFPIHEKINLPDFCEDDLFYGLSFGIVGKGQETIKQYLLKHGGHFDSYNGNGTAAIILAQPIETQRTLDAQDRNIDLLSFDDLQSIFP